VLSIRPERVVVEPRDGACDTILPARVEELVYHGDHTRCRLAVADTREFLVKLAHSQGMPRLGPGDAIRIGWRSGDCRALDGPTDPASGGAL
jgi:putative spermidine/putrescine transport system ATP-binding protein